MPANAVQQFLDHAKPSTTSRYLKITRDGMRAALKSFKRRSTIDGDAQEDTQAAEAVEQASSDDARKSEQ
jgi:hypothetical protein